jgi:GNAT superfamily N-acetyltransferase
MTYESSDGDCGVSAVATLPEARGGRIASRLLSVALRAAQARGARTTSLQATSKGAPVYTALGYRDLGRMSMWEHRVPAA